MVTAVTRRLRPAGRERLQGSRRARSAELRHVDLEDGRMPVVFADAARCRDGHHGGDGGPGVVCLLGTLRYARLVIGSRFGLRGGNPGVLAGTEDCWQVGLIGRVIRTAVVAAVDDIETRLADPESALDTEFLARDVGRALGVENAAASTAVMLPAEGGEGRAAEKTLFAGLVGHPELLAEYLLFHAFKPRVHDLRGALVGGGAWDLHDTRLQHLGAFIVGEGVMVDGAVSGSADGAWLGGTGVHG